MVKTNKKSVVALIVMAFLLVASIVMAATGAWFNDSANKSTSVKFGTVKLGTFTVADAYTGALPGDTLEDLGSVVYAGENDAWYKVEFEVTDIDGGTGAVTLTAVQGAFKGSIEAGETVGTEAAASVNFADIVLSEEIGNIYQGETVSIKVTVTVVQARNNGTSAADCDWTEVPSV